MRACQRLPVVRFTHAEPNSSTLKQTHILRQSAANVEDDDDEDDVSAGAPCWCPEDTYWVPAKNR